MSIAGIYLLVALLGVAASTVGRRPCSFFIWMGTAWLMQTVIALVLLRRGRT